MTPTNDRVQDTDRFTGVVWRITNAAFANTTTDGYASYLEAAATTRIRSDRVL